MHVNALLKSVSRSFYLSLRILPRPVRPQVGLAYLLARAADTIADTTLVAVDRRRAALARLRGAIRDAAEGGSAPGLELGELSAALEGPVGRGTCGERTLLVRLPELLETLRREDRDDRRRIRDVLETITAGQERDLTRFGDSGPGEITALGTRADLEQYTYQVAGCVGEFWTRMCLAKVCPGSALDEAQLLADAVEYGKGLQLINLLRDLAGDLRQGRCYLPQAELAEFGVRPQDLLEPASIARVHTLLDGYIRHAGAQLSAGWRYVQRLPKNRARVRLASAWPALIGARTLALLGTHNVLDPEARLKVSRREVQGLVIRSILAYPFQPSWEKLFERVSSFSR